MALWTRSRRRDAAKLLFRRLVMLVLLALVFLGSSSVWKVYEKERESKKLRLRAEAEQEDLLIRQAKLKADLGDLRTDRGIEETLREQYALAERGEGLIVIVDPPAPASAEATSTLQGLFERVFKWF